MARVLKLALVVVAAVLAAALVVVETDVLTPAREPAPIGGKPFSGTPFIRYPVAALGYEHGSPC